MSSIWYYESLIDECNERICKYERQIEGLESFEKENINGTEVFTAVTAQRRNHINDLLTDTVKHPMVKKLHSKINNAVDIGYENTVLDNFYDVKNEIRKAILQLLECIDEEKRLILGYKRTISEIKEAERREAERREAERREAERERQAADRS